MASSVTEVEQPDPPQPRRRRLHHMLTSNLFKSASSSSSTCTGCAEDSEESVDCAVCLECVVPGASSTADIACGHVFHKKCLKKWLTKADHPSCPLCKAPMDRPKQSRMSKLMSTLSGPSSRRSAASRHEEREGLGMSDHDLATILQFQEIQSGELLRSVLMAQAAGANPDRTADMLRSMYLNALNAALTNDSPAAGAAEDAEDGGGDGGDGVGGDGDGGDGDGGGGGHGRGRGGGGGLVVRRGNRLLILGDSSMEDNGTGVRRMPVRLIMNQTGRNSRDSRVLMVLY